jgi:hypothetical protein
VTHTIVLDNEAVQALAGPGHPKHRTVVAYLQVVAQRRKKAVPIAIVVPTAVRVEAGWNRSAAAWAFANRLRIADVSLDTARSNTSAAIRSRLGVQVSVVGAHVGAVIQSSTADVITVLTSDPHDIRSVAETTPVNVVVI